MTTLSTTLVGDDLAPATSIRVTARGPAHPTPRLAHAGLRAMGSKGPWITATFFAGAVMLHLLDHGLGSEGWQISSLGSGTMAEAWGVLKAGRGNPGNPMKWWVYLL